MKAQSGDKMFDLHPYFDIQQNQDCRIFSCMCQLQFIPTETPWYSFLLEEEWTSGLLNDDRKKGVLENFQEHYGELNPETSISWCSASTNCATAHPIK